MEIARPWFIRATGNIERIGYGEGARWVDADSTPGMKAAVA